MTATQTVWRLGPCLVSVEIFDSPPMTTMQCDDTFFFSIIQGRLRLVVSGDETALLVNNNGDLYLVAPSRPLSGDLTVFAHVDESIKVASLTLSVVAMVIGERTLDVRSALHCNGLQSGRIDLPADSARVQAIGLAPNDETIRVAVGVLSEILIYSASALTFAVQQWRKLNVGGPGAVLAVVPMSDSCDLIAIVGDELRLRTSGVTARVACPRAIGRPVRALTGLNGGGIVVVGPKGIWGISFELHRKQQMWGKAFIRKCDGAHGAVPTKDGRVAVWKSNAQLLYRLGKAGFTD